MTGNGLDWIDSLKNKYLKNPELLFIAMWGLAHIGHFLRKGSVLDPFAWISLFLAILLVAKPESCKRLAALAAMQLFYLFIEMPFTDNHLYIMGFINAGLLIAAIRSYTGKSNYLPMINHSMRYISAAFLIAYFAAAFAKLNSGFFDINHSCAVTMFYDSASLITDHHFLPSSLESILPYYVTITELSIPLLLVFRRTRYVGIVVLVLFHIGISLSPTATALDFTIALFALSIPFLDNEAKKGVISSFHALSKRVIQLFSSSKYSYPLAVFFVLFLIKSVSRLIFVGVDPYWLLLAPSALLFGGILIHTVFQKGLLSGLNKTYTPFSALNTIHYILLLLLIVNAASPYLGIKTIGTFTMYSNLQTENSTSNHFLIDRYFHSMPMDDMIEIKHSDHSLLSWYSQEDRMITYHELRRVLSGSPESSVQFIRGGEEFRFDKAKNEEELVTKNFIHHKLMGHRAFDPENAVCMW
jgi:hypothetical protein